MGWGMTKTEMKKASLINFIKYKMENGGDTPSEIDKVMKMAKEMSYKALHEWAVRNDFIDY